MMKRAIAIICVLILGQFFLCQKKLFKHIEVHGRLINYITKEPTTGHIELKADHINANGKPPRLRDVSLASCETNADGTFSLKSRASKGSHYYLMVDNDVFQPKVWPEPSNSSIEVKSGQNNDLGDIPAGKYTFVIKIKLVPITSTNSIWLFQYKGDNDYTYYSPNTSTISIQQCEQTYVEYVENTHQYRVRWRADVYSSSDHYILANKVADVQLSGEDTLNYTINY